MTTPTLTPEQIDDGWKPISELDNYPENAFYLGDFENELFDSKSDFIKTATDYGNEDNRNLAFKCLIPATQNTKLEALVKACEAMLPAFEVYLQSCPMKGEGAFMWKQSGGSNAGLSEPMIANFIAAVKAAKGVK